MTAWAAANVVCVAVASERRVAKSIRRRSGSVTLNPPPECLVTAPIAAGRSNAL